MGSLVTQLVSLFLSLLLFQLTPVTPETIEQVEDGMNSVMDAILLDLTTNYDNFKTDDFWHPHDFATGNVNREGIKVVGISEERVEGTFRQWKNIKLGLKQHLVGLQDNALHIYDSHLNKIVVKEMPLQSLESMEVLSHWSPSTLTPFIVILVSTSSPSPALLALTLLHSDMQPTLKEIGSLPLTSPVSSIFSLDMMDSSKKIMLVPHSPHQPISLYNLDISSPSDHPTAQLWFFQRISPSPSSPFSAALVHQPDTQNPNLILSTGDQLNVYTFDTDGGQFVVAQKLPLEHPCHKMSSFRMNYQHYLSCLENEEDKKQAHFISFNFNTNEYEEKPFKNVEGTSDLFPMSVGQSGQELLLLTVSSEQDKGNAVKTLIFDGNSEFKLSGAPCDLASCVDLPSLSNSATFESSSLSATALALPTKPSEEHASILLFLTQPTSVPSPVLLQSQLLFSQFKELSQEIARWRNVVSTAELALLNSLNPSTSNTITGNWTVKQLTTEQVEVLEGSRDGRALTSDNVFNSLKFGTVEWTEEDFISANEQVTSQMTQMRDNLKLVDSHLKDALLTSSPLPQLISSKTTMSGLLSTADSSSLQVNSLHISAIMSNDPQEYFSSLASSQASPLQITGGLTFAQPLTTTHLTTPLLSSPHSSTLVHQMALLHEHNLFECPSTFQSLSTSRDLHVTKVNNLDQFADSVLLASTISDFQLVDGIVAYANALNFAEPTPFDNVLLSSATQTITAPLTFQSLQSPQLAIQHLNSQPFTQFINEQLITSSHPSKITGKKIFKTGAALSPNQLVIQNTWNTLQFPSSFFTPTPTTQTIKLTKSQFSHLTASTVTTSPHHINGINTDNLVSLSDPDNLPHSTWTLNSISKIADNINVHQTVDGISMETLIHQGFLQDNHLSSSSSPPNAEIVFKQPIHVEDLRLTSLLNGRTYQELFANLILFSNEPVCSIPGNTVIFGDLSFLDVHLKNNQINGFSVENFLTRDSSQIVTKPVKMLESVFFSELNAHQLFDQVKIGDVLQRALRVGKIMESGGGAVGGIPWDIHFEEIECQNKLSVEHSVNGLFNYGRNAARTKGLSSQIINGPVETSKNSVFKSLTVSDLGLDPGHTLQNLDISSWSSSRAQLSEPATFPLPLSVSRLVLQDNLDSQQINGIPISTISERVLRSSMDSSTVEFTGPIHFSKGLSLHNGDIHFHQNVDGFNLDEFKAHGFPLKARLSSSQPTLISNPIQFQSLKLKEPLQLSPLVCGVNLEELQSDSVKKSSLSVDISGQKSFSSTLSISSHLNSPQLNGKSLSSAFLLSRDQQVDSHATFSSHVTKSTLSAPSINQVPLASLSSKFSSSPNGKDFKVEHDVLMKGPLTTDHLRVSGTTNHQTLSTFLNDAISLDSPQISFAHPVTILPPISTSSPLTTHTYNNIQMDQLLSQVILLSQSPLTLPQPTSFFNSLSAPTLAIQGSLSAPHLSNQIDWPSITQNAVKVNELITMAKMQFEQLSTSSPISTHALNSLPLSSYITLSTPQPSLGSLQIASLSLSSSNSGLFNSQNLSALFTDTLLQNPSSPQTVSSSSVTFTSPLHISNKLNSCFGSPFTSDLISTTEAVELQGPFLFTTPLTIQSPTTLDGSLGPLPSISSLFETSFNPTLSSEIGSAWSFTQPVTFQSSLSGPAITPSLNIQSILSQTHSQLARAQSQVDASKKVFLRKCSSLLSLRHQLASNPVHLSAFELHQTLPLSSPLLSILALHTSTPSPLLLMQTTNCQLLEYQWSPTSQSLHLSPSPSPTLSSLLGSASSMQSAESQDGTTIIAYSNSPSSSPCPSTQPPGLFYLLLSTPNSPTPLSTNELPISSFSLQSHPSTHQIHLFNLLPSALQIFSWDPSSRQFSATPTLIPMSSPMLSLQVSPSPSGGFGLLCHNPNSISMYQLSPDLKITSEGETLPQNSVPLAAFQVSDTLHALLTQSAEQSASLVKPSCNLELLSLAASPSPSPSLIQSVQKFSVPQLVSSTTWSFSGQQFAAFLSKSNGLFLYKFMGLNGFQPLSDGHPIKIFDALAVHSFSVQIPSERSVPQPMLLVLSQNKVELLKGTVFGDTLDFDFEPLCNQIN